MLIEAKRYIRRDDRYVDVQICGFVAVPNISFTGSGGAEIQAIYVCKGGDGQLLADNIDTFQIIAQKEYSVL